MALVSLSASGINRDGRILHRWLHVVPGFGNRVGVKLDEATGKNGGTVKGHQCKNQDRPNATVYSLRPGRTVRTICPPHHPTRRLIAFVHACHSVVSPADFKCKENHGCLVKLEKITK